MKPTFIFYIDWYNYIEEDIEQEGLKLRLYRAIPHYAFTGEEPDDPAMKVLFSFIRRQLDRDAEKYEAKIEKRREAGRKHSGNQYTRAKEALEQNGTNGTSVPKMEQNGTNGTDNNNGNVNDNKNDLKETSNEEKKIVVTAVTTLPKRADKFYKELIPFVQIYGKEMVRAFYDYWTEPNKSKSKMRWEMEKTWDLKRRLATWANREKTNNNNNSNGNNRTGTTKEQMLDDAQQLVAELLGEG